jgi:tetratricopeptide (TPR) repeat protein
MRGASHIGLSQFDKAVADYTKAIELKPEAEKGHYWTQRGSIYVQLAQFEKAASDFGTAVELDPNNAHKWYLQALIHLVMSDAEGYRKRCANMLEHFSQSEIPDIQRWVAWTCVLGPDAIEDLTQSVKLAEWALESDPENDHYRNTLGAILYRAGRFEEAVEKLTKLANAREETGQYPQQTSPAYAWYFLAMAQHQLGNIDESLKYYNKAVKRAEQELAGNPPWNRKITLQLLEAEAESLLSITRKAHEND